MRWHCCKLCGGTDIEDSVIDMGDGNADPAKSVVKVELKIYMHCDGCARLVRRSVKKIKGVETVEVDREENKVTVTGNFKTEELVKKIEKKTGKRVEVLDEENADPAERITAEVKIYMHCDACERLVRRSVQEIKGVETVGVDRDDNEVTVTGHFRTEKLVKKMKKKTGKKPELLVPEESEEEPDAPGHDLPQVQETFGVYDFQDRQTQTWDHYFDDENTEGCIVM